MNQFRKAFRGIDQAIQTGTNRALNKALASAKTKMVRALREETGLKTEIITTRTRARKSKGKELSVSLNVAIKFPIALSKFDPKEKAVRVPHKGTRSTYKHFGVTVKIGKQARQLAPGAFFLSGKTGEAVIGRKGAFNTKGEYVNPNASKYKTAQLKTNIFTESAKANEAPTTKHLKDTFERIVSHEIEFAISSKFESNK